MAAYPRKSQDGNTLIFEQSGRFHFVNLVTNDYYWVSRTDITPYKLVKNGDSDYFGFKEGDNDLFYFHKCGHKVIDCDTLKTELATINMDRKKGDKFYCDEPVKSTFWINYLDGEVCSDARGVATKKYDMFEIHRKYYHIWHENKKQMDLHFWRIEKCIGPCVCKSIHVEADYVPEKVEKHRGFSNSHEFALQFRDYVDLAKFEYSREHLPILEKSDLVVYTPTPIGDRLYNGVYQSHLNVVAKEIDVDYDEQHRLLPNLFGLSGIKHIVQFHGIFKFEERDFLVFEGFKQFRNVVDLGLSNDELLHNLKGLIKAVACMQELPFSAHMWGNISRSSLVVTGAHLGQARLKIFIPGLGVKGKSENNDTKGLGDIMNLFTSSFPIPEFKDLVRCLRRSDNWDHLKILIEHPIFWTVFEKLDFFCNVFEVVKENEKLCLALSTIKEAVETDQAGNIDFEFFFEMESYSSYAQGSFRSKVGQLVRMIRHSKIHDLDLPNHVRELYGKSRAGLEDYFRVRYPNLCFQLFKLVRMICPEHDHFAQFPIFKLPKSIFR